MIEQYLSNINENITVHIEKKNLQVNKGQILYVEAHNMRTNGKNRAASL
jgi:hypothetical protein